MTTYEDLVDATLKYNLVPTVVPQLKTITLGGAVSGLGIESSSFKYGLVHETVQELEVLLADGTTVVGSPRENADLFYGFPNSYGTLGYALRLKVKLVPAKQYVRLTHRKFSELGELFQSWLRSAPSDNSTSSTASSSTGTKATSSAANSATQRLISATTPT